jgi:hypothetical protein
VEIIAALKEIQAGDKSEKISSNMNLFIRLDNFVGVQGLHPELIGLHPELIGLHPELIGLHPELIG